jgi:CRP-like cAMP-binding protein
MTARRLRMCPDCPATRIDALVSLVDSPTGCAFACVSLAARQPIPESWSGAHAMALVRRGILVRQRVDSHGRAIALDALGPGCATPLHAEDGTAGYAASDALVCLLPRAAHHDAVTHGDRTAHDVVRLHASALARVERIAEARGRANAEARVAGLFCALVDTISPDAPSDVVPSALTHRDFAALLAMRHESVCRAFTRLVSRRAVERVPSGIRIVDRAMLEAL